MRRKPNGSPIPSWISDQRSALNVWQNVSRIHSTVHYDEDRNWWKTVDGRSLRLLATHPRFGFCVNTLIRTFPWLKKLDWTSSSSRLTLMANSSLCGTFAVWVKPKQCLVWSRWHMLKGLIRYGIGWGSCPVRMGPLKTSWKFFLPSAERFVARKRRIVGKFPNRSADLEDQNFGNEEIPSWTLRWWQERESVRIFDSVAKPFDASILFAAKKDIRFRNFDFWQFNISAFGFPTWNSESIVKNCKKFRDNSDHLSQLIQKLLLVVIFSGLAFFYFFLFC